MLLFGIKLKKPYLLEVFVVTILSLIVSLFFGFSPQDLIFTTFALSMGAFLSSIGLSPWNGIKDAFVFFPVLIIFSIPVIFFTNLIYS